MTEGEERTVLYERGEMLNQIEALQQENEQLRTKLEDWKHEVKCHMDEVIAREKQIEQLRAQVARMRKALEQIEEHLSSAIPVEGFFENMHCCSAGRIAEDALAAIDAIGGKEDE